MHKTKVVWTFDTSTTHHITADYSCLQDPTLDTTSIKVGGGRVPHATYKGTVRLVVEGTGILFSLSDVLFIPGWSETSLISWRKIAPKCRMTGEDDWISVSLKNENPLFSARSIGPNLYELPVRVNNAVIGTNATNAVIGTNAVNANDVNATALSSAWS